MAGATFGRPFPVGPIPPYDEFGLKETRPLLAGERTGAYDLVEKMEYLYVRVVKARELKWDGGLDPFVEVKLGNYTGTTRHFEKTASPEWNDVFAFSRERIQASFLDVVVRGRGFAKEEFVGRVRFDVTEIPTRVPPDSELAPEWHRIVDKNLQRKGELMLAVWFGTQADECFPLAVHADAISVDAKLAPHVRCKQYTVPRLWYVRVNVIEAQDIFIADKARAGEIFVRSRLASQVHRTRICSSRLSTFGWNEDHLFVAAEPFEDQLIISVEDRVKIDKEEVVGHVHIPLAEFDRRWDDRPLRPRWFNLRRPEQAAVKDDKFSAKVCLRLGLEGGYRVLSEPVHYISDVRPTARELWSKRPAIGLVELGIHNAMGLQPTRVRNGRGSCDAYCVAKYGVKWFRTQTVIDSLAPRFHQQCYWDVHDSATVLTVCVFHNCQIGEKGGLVTGDAVKDILIGKVRIRLSTLETGRIYTHAYPLIALQSAGVKKMGEVQLAVRFSCTSKLGLLRTYARPHLPPMHYLCPLSVVQQETLRREAVQIIAHRLGRNEPPLRREVVEHLCDAYSLRWSMRRSKANFFRIVAALSPVFAAVRWFTDVCRWKNPVTTILVHILYTMHVCNPGLILPTIFLYTFLVGLWNYRHRPRHPWHMDTKISYAELAHPDELDEEFDDFPTSRPHDTVRIRYDRVRSLGARIQEMVGDLAVHAERLRCLLIWRDPRATAMFLFLFLCLAVVTYVVPFEAVALVPGFYLMRHPRFRQRAPSVPMNFFRRLPSKVDCLL